MTRLKDNRGFSMLELVLALVVGGMIVTVTTESLVSNMDQYQFIANRKSALGDGRYAMNRISQELLQINTGSITSTGSTEIQFADDSGSLVKFHLASSGGKLKVYRNSDVLVDNVTSFTFSYFDADGNLLAASDATTKTNAKRIKFSITTAPVGDEGSVSLSTVVTPRDFIGYSNYQ